MEQQPTTTAERLAGKLRQSTTLRLFVIGILILVLLIPGSMIEGLIRERQESHDNAVNEISEKWARSQHLTGPVLAVPYTAQVKDEKGQVSTIQEYSYYLPDNLVINGDMQSSKRHRGIYEAVLYENKLHISGNFAQSFLSTGDGLPLTADLKGARILMGISDVRGIRNKVAIKWDSAIISAQPGGGDEVAETGISFPVGNLNLQAGGNFAFDLQLAGSGSVYFTPVGKSNEITITSNWATPSFDGAFLPTNESITKQGFTATWKVLELNRNFVQHWNGANQHLSSSDFGVKMLIAADEYQKSFRSVHYCILFISLTFIFYFIIELRSGINVHPVQYLLIGLGISMFYLLLLSLAEWLGFNNAYFISAAAVTTLISLFTMGVLSNKFYAALAGVIQVLLYLFLYTTLQLEDLSLLIGSIGLFITLAILMYFSSRLNRANNTPSAS